MDSSVFTYVPATKTFTVFTTDSLKKGDIFVKISGKLGIFNTVDYVFKVSIVCNVLSITTTFPMTDHYYYVENEMMVIPSP